MLNALGTYEFDVTLFFRGGKASNGLLMGGVYD